MLFEACRDCPGMFEFVEEALDQSQELNTGMFTRCGMGLMLAQAPWSVMAARRASLS